MDLSTRSLRRLRRGSSLCFWGYILLFISANLTVEYADFNVSPLCAVGFVVVLGLFVLAGTGMSAGASVCGAAAAVLVGAFTLGLVLLRIDDRFVLISIVSLGASLACQFVLLRSIAVRCTLRRLKVELRYFLSFLLGCLAVAALTIGALHVFGAGEGPIVGTQPSQRPLLTFYGFSIAPTGDVLGIVTVYALFIICVLLAVASVVTLLRCFWFTRDWARREMNSRRGAPRARA